MNAERIFSGLLLAAALFLLFLAWGYTAPIAYDPIGPRPYPVLVLSLLAVCLFYLMLRRNGGAALDITPLIRNKLLMCLAAMLAYALLFELLGFPLATALMVFAVGKLFGGKTVPCLVTAAALGGGLYLLFDRLLDVTLPLGFGL